MKTNQSEQFTIMLQLDLNKRQVEGNALVGDGKLIRANLYLSAKDKLWNLVFNIQDVNSATSCELVLEHYKAQDLMELTNRTHTLYIEDEGILKVTLNSSDFQFKELPDIWFENNDL
ncbi:MAG: hypothetical protein KC478_04525 [Bacteriovoracaceae bacterium]|nr:hypothetical protein [Bacteriovoracaceae bacterium]